ncbi:centrosomal protein 290kDa [Haematobia irritans]|uniref:centrosomal protein 290kDa n=1 Tax=Haematobia irritans TaxID=7368 RepID=UPI003F4FA9B1
MELPEVVSVRKFKEFSPKQKEEVYETILQLARVIEDLPKKSLRKTLDLSLAVLDFKGRQVQELEAELDAKDQGSLESQHDRLVDENEKLKRMLSQLEDERLEYKRKIKELTEDMFSLQKRLQEAVTSNAEGSDKDSSDPLSELDKQETLLRNINTKNKHIKRLLREIESLQNENIEQSKTILTLEKDVQHNKETVLKLKADLTLAQSEKSAHKETIQELNNEIKRLEGNIIYLEDEREKSEAEVKDFINQLEKKANAWKKLIEEKDKQLKKLKDRNERSDGIQSPSKSSETKTESEELSEQEEKTKLLHSLECRDRLIEQLELKIKTMAEEMIASTQLMNKITAEREHERNPQNPRSCCKAIEMALKTSNEKCRELTEMLEKAEEECCLKAKQALEASNALTAYQKGEDGLLTALRKCSSLENKLQSRDKQIRALVMELNSLHEIAQENTLLRKRLNIPEDVVITTKNLSAKERNKEKMIEKLTLKLRASEEMRLQLKMEKCDLRKELLELQRQLNTSPEKRTNAPHCSIQDNNSPKKTVEELTKLLATKSPNHSPKTRNGISSRRSSREMGEVEDSCHSAEASLMVTVCSQCHGNLRVELQDQASRESEIKYQEVLEENDLLRQGMLEILEKLREYDDCSENITINDKLLQRLIKALKISSSPTNTPKRLRDEVQKLKERETALEEHLSQRPQPSMGSQDLISMDSLREEGEIQDLDVTPLEIPQFLDSSTRPTTPNKSLNIPNIQTPTTPGISLADKRQRDLDLEEMKVYKKYYEELQLHLDANEVELMQTCSKLTKQILQLELNLTKETKSSLYMREDFDKNLAELKNLQLNYIESEGELKQEISSLKETIEKLKRDIDYHKEMYIYSNDEYLLLQKSFQQSQMQLAYLTQEMLKGTNDSDFKIPEMCLDYGIIQDDLQLSFITQQEYESQMQMIKDFQSQRMELQRKITQLESLLEIAQNQIGSQQKLLNDITDNHINLRHLVADLQSTTEEKFLLAKMQRDLDEECDKITNYPFSLSAAKNQIEDLENQLRSLKGSTPAITPGEQSMPSLQSDVIEKTILSFHTLLNEKDKSIGKYQDILQTEREQTQLNTSKLTAEIDGLKNTINNLNFNIKTKDLEIMDLKSQLEISTVRRNSNEKLNLARSATGGEENVDNSLNEMTDEKIEELFEENLTSPAKGVVNSVSITEKHELEEVKDIPENFVKQLKELKEKASYWESALKVKEDEISILKDKIRLLDDREKSNANSANPEIEQLRSLLEEKDRHINELMDTLNNFHDDQERYINDSSNYSAEQIAKLAADLTRTEATNKIYQTQVEALRKQLTSLTHREKQARELNQSLRQQLIKRPVVSIKTELNARVKNENLQKRLQQLELDLEDARAEIQRQKVIIESKRVRSANEVGLWEKQKRWQQSAEKYKAKLEETEIMLEKTRSLLQAARTTINRLEKDKQILEAKLGRFTHQHVQNSMKCCRTPSCPNLHHHGSPGHSSSGGGAKYTPSESPETYTGASSECSSPGRSVIQQTCKSHFAPSSSSSVQNPHDDIIHALKARIEMQQRKILALELEGKGSNALTTEMEKLQEKLSATEAQNVRLEAKNLQLQLDNDLLRQGDGTERLQKRIKHLEDYIIALKEERASSEARRELCKCTGIKVNIQSGQSAEHTIIALRNIVEKLRAENKYLKDGRRSCESRSSTEMSMDSGRLQQMYTESIEKIAALQMELKQQIKCPHCENKQKLMDTSPLQDELRYVKEQLIKKTQLLQKAKVLLTRAAAKEKVLKEQLAMWKRKCSELQNVPVIDEISE